MAFVELNHRGEYYVTLLFDPLWYTIPYYVLTDIAIEHFKSPSHWKSGWLWEKPGIFFSDDGKWVKDFPPSFYRWLDCLGNDYWRSWHVQELKEFLTPYIDSLKAYIDYRKIKLVQLD